MAERRGHRSLVTSTDRCLSAPRRNPNDDSRAIHSVVSTQLHFICEGFPMTEVELVKAMQAALASAHGPNTARVAEASACAAVAADAVREAEKRARREMATELLLVADEARRRVRRPTEEPK